MPTTSVTLYEEIPLRADYNDTILFSSATVRSTFFSGKTHYSYNNYSYVRRDGLSGVIRVGAQIGNIYRCNYLIFKNANSSTTAYENIDTFCFVTKVEYENDNTTLVYFTVDVVQTWLFVAALQPCYIERQHTPTDDIGQDASAEDFVIKDYVTIAAQASGQMGQLGVLVASTFTADQLTNYYGGIYAGTFSGLCFTFFSLRGTGDVYPDPSSLVLWLQGVDSAGKSDGIISMCMIPSGFITGSGQQPTSDEPTAKTITINKNQANIDGYTPKNKRLLSYPYNKLTVSNMQGGENDYRFEMFGGDVQDDPTKLKFTLYGDCNADPEIIAAPLYYNRTALYNGNTATYTNADFSRAISIRAFPQCAWNADVYKIWIANKRTQVLAGLQSDLINMEGAAALSVIAPEIAPFAALPAVTSAFGRVTGALAENASMQRQPAQVRNSQSNNILAELNMLDFVFSTKTIRAAQARIIDDYFNMFGYAIKRCQVPNRNARPHWTFLKTTGCRISGNIPADANAELCRIYDHGVRFWNNAAEIGDFSLDNSPSS